jgi:uracil-DNA glycosylase
MHHIILDSEIDFDGWRQAARTLALNGVNPSDVTWTVRGNEPELFEAQNIEEPPEPPQNSFNVPAKFVALARVTILHRDAERFAVLYRLLWRLRSDHDLLNAVTDPDVAEATAMTKAVQHDQHRMQASVRFREIGREQKSHFVAWFAPEHHIVEATAPFFASRYADMPWSILTPDVCAHWDGHTVSFTPGLSTAEAPGENRLEENRLEETWRRYAATHFNRRG